MDADPMRDHDRMNGNSEYYLPEASSPRSDVDDRLRERRRQVADDALEDALALPDPFHAAFAASTAILARVEAAIGERLAAALEDSAMSLEEAALGIQVYLGAARQMERHSQLERRDRESRRKETEPSRRKDRFPR